MKIWRYDARAVGWSQGSGIRDTHALSWLLAPRISCVYAVAGVPLQTLDLISIPPSTEATASEGETAAVAAAVVGESKNDGSTAKTETSVEERSGGVGSSGSLESEVRNDRLSS